jgi:hypothetical protein
LKRAPGRGVLVGFAVGAAFVVPGVARGQGRQEILVGKHQTFESPQHFAFELRFSPYKPDVDSDPQLQGATPYQTAFGSSRRVMVAGEFDWQALRIPHLGTLGPGVAIGYTKMSANATFLKPHNGQTVSGETTSLELLPLYAVAVLRADVLWREVHIPLVPYAKVGVGLALWRASNTLGTSSYQGVSGEGETWGTQFALGVGLNLNIFDEYAAKNFDESMGVNNTYLFGEVMRSDLSGLGIQKHPLRVGDSTWVVGIAFEF